MVFIVVPHRGDYVFHNLQAIIGQKRDQKFSRLRFLLAFRRSHPHHSRLTGTERILAAPGR